MPTFYRLFYVSTYVSTLVFPTLRKGADSFVIQGSRLIIKFLKSVASNSLFCCCVCVRLKTLSLQERSLKISCTPPLIITKIVYGANLVLVFLHSSPEEYYKKGCLLLKNI